MLLISIRARTLYWVTAIIVMSACTQPTTVSSTWHELKQNPARPYDKILVVGVSDDSNQRRRFENMMLDQLKTSGTRAWASHQSMQPGSTVNRDNITAVITRTGATAVIVTRLVNQQVSADEINARTGHKTRRKNDSPVDFFRYDYDEYEEPAYLVVKSTVTLSTDLYDTKNDQLLYSIETTTFDKESGAQIIDAATSAIVRRLRRDGFVP